MNSTITVFSGNLFQIAAQYLGDATQWIRIAELNRLRDPVIRQQIQLVLPPTDPSAGGGIVSQS
jgi:nucleoid-associated protein YgaU